MAASASRYGPVPTNASKARVHEFAENVAGQLNFGPGDALEPVVVQLGGRISYHSPALMADAPTEAIIVEGDRSFVIFLPTTTSPQRDRFTIAHELGHLFLHYPLVQSKFPGATMEATRWVASGDEAQQRAEWEANWFAAAFLMPEEQFRAIWSSRQPAAAADHFGVSLRAAEVRAKSLGVA